MENIYKIQVDALIRLFIIKYLIGFVYITNLVKLV